MSESSAIQQIRFTVAPTDLDHSELPNWSLAWVLFCGIVWSLGSVIAYSYAYVYATDAWGDLVVMSWGMIVSVALLLNGFRVIQGVSR